MPYPQGIRPDALVQFECMSIYNVHTALMPERMAWGTPDMVGGLAVFGQAVSDAGGTLYLSDAYRNTEEQARSRYDYLLGVGRLSDAKALVKAYPLLETYRPRPKSAYSPPPGFGVHEGGRAIDIELDPKWTKLKPVALGHIAADCGWVCALGAPENMVDSRGRVQNEAWHWEFRGPYQDVYDSVLAGTNDRKNAYRSMAQAMIRDIRV